MNKALNIIREIAMFVFVLTNIIPGISNKILVMVSILIWVIMCFIIDKRKAFDFFIKPNIFTYSIYLWLLCSTLYIILGYDRQLNTYIFSYYRIGIISLIYYYYYKNNLIKNMKFVIIYTILILTIVNIITINANMWYYNLSRILSTGANIEIDKVGIGSYHHIYGLIFIIISIISLMFFTLKQIIANKNVEKNKVFYYKLIVMIIFMITSLYAIYITEFSIAFFLLGLAFLFAFIKPKKKYLNTLECILLVITIVLIAIPITRETCKVIYENTDSKNLKIRAQDIYLFLLEGRTENTIDLKARLDKYEKSIKAFKDNVLFGSMQYNDEYNQIGTHSELLDLLGKYGIIGSIPFLIYLICMYITFYKTFITSWAKKTFIICISIYTIFMFINTALFIAPMFMAFTITPMIIHVVDNDFSNKEKNG